MAKIAYATKSLRSSSQKLLDKMAEIVEDYEDMGYRITVRQLYYRLIRRMKQF